MDSMSCPVCKSSSFGVIKNIDRREDSALAKYITNQRREFDLNICLNCGVVYSHIPNDALFD